MVLVAHLADPEGSRQNNSYLFFMACFVAVTVAAAGCVAAPIPMTKRVHGYSGEPTTNTMDLKFIRVGETKHDDVSQHLHWADSGVKDERLFWGRWISSGSGIVWGVGGGTSGEGGVARHWVAHNLFVQFDEYGTVSQVHEVPDGEIMSQLGAFVLNNALDLDLSSPVEIQAKHRKSNSIGDIVVHLRLDSLRVENAYGSKKNFQVAPEKIQQVTASDTGDPVFTQVILHLSERTPAGSDPSFDMRPAELFVLARYFRHVCPSALGGAAGAPNGKAQ
jgi:hypothetical protein